MHNSVVKDFGTNMCSGWHPDDCVTIDHAYYYLLALEDLVKEDMFLHITPCRMSPGD